MKDSMVIGFEQREIPQFVISAPSSGSGKTTVSRGLMAALVRRGLNVQPFKCGPDYIDTKFHESVCLQPSYNLDTAMASGQHLMELYTYYANKADATIVEGMMGLYDGYEKWHGSAAEVAKLLGLPVILVVDAKSTGFSVAPLLHGFRSFDASVEVSGVIFNRVDSPRHYRMLQEACAEVDLPCLGYLPKDKTLDQKSRYLGLDFSQEEQKEATDYLAGLIEENIDVARLLELTTAPISAEHNPFTLHPQGNLHITVLRNAESFSFIYAEHLDILTHMGLITYIDPEMNQPVPRDTDLLYIPGGYPEKHAVQLSEAKQCLDSVRDYIERGGRTLAECGGMMYLSKGIRFDESPSFVPLCGVLPFSISCRAADRKLSIGYRAFEYKGVNLRGHEFHYTQFSPEEDADRPRSIAQVYNLRKEEEDTPVFCYKNLIASYTHLYWGEINVLKLFE